MNNTTTHKAAITYAAQGIRVFPCWYGAKNPKTKNGLHDATTDPAQLGKWFSTGDNNIAIATGAESEVCAIDADTYAGGDLQPLETEIGALPQTREARTRAGGRHLLFRYPDGYSLGSYNGQIAPHIDLKANGGYIIASPSWVKADEKGPAGNYEWVNDLPLADLPRAWCERWASLGGKAAGGTAGHKANPFAAAAGYSVPDRVDKGGRNEAVLRYCGYLRGNGMPEALIFGAAHDFNRARCVPPLDGGEIESIVQRYANPETNDPSGWPDPKPIDPALPDVKPFDTKLLPTSFRPFVEDQAELMQIAPDFIAAPLMVAAGAAIGNGITIAPKEHDIGWLVSTVLWGGGVGRPGTLKSPAVDRAMRPLSILESDMQASFDQRKAQYAIDKLSYVAALKKAQAAAAAGKPATPPIEPEEPKPERIITNDSTSQMLGEIQRHSPRGVMVLRDELVSLLETLSAEGQEGARGYYLEGWNGLGSYRIDRVGRGSFIIPRHALWVYGGIQPGKLQAYIKQAVHGGGGDDGLLQRFQLLVWPDTSKDWKNVDRSPNFEAMQIVDDTFKRLRYLDPAAIGAKVDALGTRPAYLHFSSEAQEVFNGFRAKLEKPLRTGDKHPALDSHLSKYRSLVPALALIIHLADGGTGPVTQAALRKAIGWSTYLWSHARRVYASVTNSSAFGAKALADKITAGKLVSGFTAREVQRHGWPFMNTAEDVRTAIDWLVDAGWLRATRTTNDGIGRPTDIFNINPKCMEK
jgi:hypothetical protein